MLQVPGGRGIFSAARFSTSACAPISTVISLHCVSLDSILPRHSARAAAAAGKSWARRRIRVNIGVSSFSHRSRLFLRRPPSAPASPFAARPPLSLSVGVNLSPRLSPNTELYKLKPISLPGLGSSYSGPLYFRLFVVGKHAWSSSQQPSNRQRQRRWRRYPACTPGYTATSRIPSAYASALI